MDNLDSNASSTEKNETETSSKEADSDIVGIRSERRKSLTRDIYHKYLELLRLETSSVVSPAYSNEIANAISAGLFGIATLLRSGMNDEQIKKVIESTLEVLDERTPPRTRGPRSPQ